MVGVRWWSDGANGGVGSGGAAGGLGSGGDGVQLVGRQVMVKWGGERVEREKEKVEGKEDGER